MKLLYPRGSKGYFIKCFEVSIQISCLFFTFLFHHMQSLDIDLDKDLDSIAQTEPYIVVTGKPGDGRAQFYIYAEKMLTIESKSLRDAFFDLICSYYVFNISYPNSLKG